MHAGQKSHSPRYQLSMMAALAIGLLATVPAQASPTFEVSGGVLYGIDGVVVDGSNYSVAFDVGSCATLFSGCTSTSDFTFQTLGGAEDASSALASIFSGGDVNTNFPSGIVGESGGLDKLWTPYLLSSGNVFFAVASVTTIGSTFSAGGSTPIGTPTGAGKVWAVWSVPEPGALFLFGAGLLGLVALHRRRAVKRARV